VVFLLSHPEDQKKLTEAVDPTKDLVTGKYEGTGATSSGDSSRSAGYLSTICFHSLGFFSQHFQVIYLIVIVAVRAETPGIQTASADRMTTMKMTCKKEKKTCEDVKLAPTKNMHWCMKINDLYCQSLKFLPKY